MLRDIRFFQANFTITPSNSVNTSALNFSLKFYKHAGNTSGEMSII